MFQSRVLSPQPSPLIEHNLYGHDEFSGPWMGSSKPGTSNSEVPVSSTPSRGAGAASDADLDSASEIRFIDSGSILSGDESASQDGSMGRINTANLITQIDVDNFVRISSPPRSLILAGSAIYVIFNHGSEVGCTTHSHTHKYTVIHTHTHIHTYINAVQF